jgi:hypothetical protein
MPLQGDITGASIVVAGTTIEQNLATLLSTFGSGGSTGVFESGTLFPTLVPGTNITMSGTSPNLTISATGGSGGSSGIVELLQGTLASTGTATVGLGLSLAGATNPTLANSGLLDLSGTTGHITLGTNLSLSGQTLNAAGASAQEFIQGTLTATGNATLGQGLTLAGATNPTLSNSGVLAFGGDTGSITLGPNLTMSGQTLTVNQGLVEIVSGSSIGTGNVTLGTGLTLTGTANPTLANSGVVSFGGDSGAIVLGQSLAMSGQTLNVQGIGTIQAIVGASTQGASTLNSGTNITFSGTSPNLTISATAGGGSSALVIENQGTSIGSAGTLNALAPATLSLSGSIATILANSTAISSGTVSSGQIIQANTLGLADTSFMPIGPGPVQLASAIGGCYALGATTTFSGSAFALVANRVYVNPFMVARPTTINNLGAYVSTAVASSTFSVGIYADNGGSGGNQPTGSPLTSASGLSGATTGTILGTVGTPYILQPNVIYWRVLATSAAITVKSLSIGGDSLLLGLTSAAIPVPGLYTTGSGSTLPAPFSGALTSIGTNPPPMIINT